MGIIVYLRYLAKRGRGPVRCGPLLVALGMGVAVLACQPNTSSQPFRVPNRYWLESQHDEAALSVAAQRIRVSVARSLRNGVLAVGFPRDCTVTAPPMLPASANLNCLEGGPTPDGLLLDSTGSFLQFVPIDFLSSRAFLFEVYLVPDSATGSALTPETAFEYPHVAIPHFPLPEDTYRQMLRAVVRGIRESGAVPF